MRYEILTDRFEIEKIVENMSLPSQGDEIQMYLDYNDIRTIRKISTLKYCISCEVCCSNNKIIEKIASTIKSLNLSLSEVRSYLVNISTDTAKPALGYEILGDILNLIREIEITENPEHYYDGVWSFSSNSSIPLGVCYINIVFGVNKAEQDKLEDAKIEQMIEEYHKSKLPPMEWDSSELFINLNNKNWK